MTKENQIEENFIEQLVGLKYVYRPDIIDRKTLEQNFKTKFEALNRVNLSENEFLRLKEVIIKNDVFAASKFLREKQYFQREDGTPLHYTLVNNKDWCKNDFEVINQLRINTENSHHRYDVILLINGLPLVQIELKNIGITPKQALEQIIKYKNETGNGYGNSLLCFMQLFIVSNKSNTYYFANNNNKHFAFNSDEKFLPIYQLADENNRKIADLYSFTEKFLSKCTLAEMISKYMVLVASEQKLLVMRPYQIYAVKAIVDCINQNRGNGYIWHTTGSGKTLTSFKTSTILKENPEIEKCLFVVDRKDLDRQTRIEFNKFQEGSVEENTNTENLVRRLLSTDKSDKVIVCTIQKLGIALDETNKPNYKERLKPLSNKRMVFIFDECHRSQFGDNHKAIKEFFPKAQLFGFTGTPIFEDNATYTQINGEEKNYKITKDIFEHELHKYTITNAIEDKNVLKFHIDYFKPKATDTSEKAGAEVTQKAIVEAILEKHQAATNNRKFNAVFATASIANAIEYYQLFKDIQNQIQVENPEYQKLNIACVFSPPALLIGKEGDHQSQKNANDIKQLQEDLAQEREDNKQNPEEKKKALMTIIEDYNFLFKTNHTINEFDLYYQDIQSRIKDQQYSNKEYAQANKIDIIIVVDMLLTGFDSKYLNTLYVDKNLKHHGLIQAFSRTNRVLNDTKPHGNILDFRSQQEAVNAAITLFSGLEEEEKSKEIWLVDPAPVVIQKFKEAVEKLGIFMQDQGLVCEPQEVYNVKGDAAKINFINNFKEVQRQMVALNQFTDLVTEQKELIKNILPEDTFLEFRSSYLETAKAFKNKIDKQGDKAPANLLQLDFEFILFASAIIDYDYIIKITADNLGKTPSQQKLTKEQIKNLLKSNANFMDDDDFYEYIDSLDWNKGQTEKQLREGFQQFKDHKYNKEIAQIANKQGIETAVLNRFIEEIFSRMIFDGEKLTDLLEPLELSWKERRVKELSLMADLVPQLKKLAGEREISGLAAYE